MSHKVRTDIAIISLFMAQNHRNAFKIENRMIAEHLKQKFWSIFRTSKAQSAAHSQQLEIPGNFFQIYCNLILFLVYRLDLCPRR